MKKRLLWITVIVALLFCSLPLCVSAEQKDDVIILYENDVHCEIDGYSAISALRNELKTEYEHVGIVTSGDFLQGGSIGSISRGEYVVRIMNLVGYDAIALGNHEFDYGMDRLLELTDMLDTKPVCANLKRIGEGECFAPYSIVTYGDLKIAYVGITTPTTPDTTSLPSQFTDADKNPLYTFSKEDLGAVVQENVDKARAEGADLVIALSHLGDTHSDYNASAVVSATVGLDAVLDAHSHSVIESSILLDKNGNEVLYTSTGTKFANVGKLTISEDGITAELISLEDYQSTDPVVDACIKQVKEEYSALGNKTVGESYFDLITHDSTGNRLIRISETNLGNLVSDAFRHVLNADVAYINGGAIRSDIKAGEVTFNDLLNVFPFDNSVVVVEVTGKTIVEMLELAVSKWPEENASYPQVSGLTFSVNVLGNENAKVYNVKIENRRTGVYEDLLPDQTYTVASNNFILLECGDGMTMFEGAKVVSDTGILDVEILERYITEELGGIIDGRYALAVRHVTFTEGFLDAPESDGDHAIWIAAIGIILAITTIVTVLTIRKKRAKNQIQL